MKTAEENAALYAWRLDPKLAQAIWGGDELVRTYGSSAGTISLRDARAIARPTRCTAPGLGHHAIAIDAFNAQFCPAHRCPLTSDDK